MFLSKLTSIFQKKHSRSDLLLSVHIPKCAGTSFRQNLQTVYRERLLLDYKNNVERPIPPHIKIIHGHFPIARYLHDHPGALTMTWLRHPADRIVSYYYYWKGAPAHGNPLHDRFLAQNPSLTEFAMFPEMRREVAGNFFGGMDWRKLDFVGLVEQYPADLQRLAEELRWPRRPTMVAVNQTPAKAKISSSERARLEQILAPEMEIYAYWKDKVGV